MINLYPTPLINSVETEAFQFYYSYFFFKVVSCIFFKESHNKNIDLCALEKMYNVINKLNQLEKLFYSYLYMRFAL